MLNFYKNSLHGVFMRIMGIDEAGRGSAIGPLVIAGAVCENCEDKLLELGVKDSKLLSKERREEIFKSLPVEYKVIEIWPPEIDKGVETINLNNLEMYKFAMLIDELKPDKVIIDTPSHNTERFKNSLMSKLSHKCEIICENKADLKYPIVAAASIIAKVIRDRRIDEISEAVGFDVGIGYPSDQKTLEFIEFALGKPELLRKYVRKSWLTFERIKSEKEQRKLSDWLC